MAKGVTLGIDIIGPKPWAVSGEGTVVTSSIGAKHCSDFDL